MNNTIARPPFPINEPVRGYAPGSSERASLKRALMDMRSREHIVTPYINGKHVETGKTEDIFAPHELSHRIGTLHKVGTEHVQQAIDAAVDARHDWMRMAWTDRAAIFLMSLGEREATEVLKHMPVSEVQKLGKAMATIDKVSVDQAENVLAMFTEILETEAPLAGRSPQFLKRLLSGSLGEERANSLLGRLADDVPTGLDSLQLMESHEVTELIRAEHPQVIAIVLAGLEAKKSGEILAELPKKLASEIIARIARMEEVPRHAIEELDRVMQQRSSMSSGFKVAAIGGVRTAAEILNAAKKETGEKIIADLDERDKDRSEQIQENMFIFENLAMLDDRGMQTLLRDVTSESLVMALKGADDVIKEKVFGNMSKRAAELLKDDLDAKGPVRLSEVEEAQKEIVTTARRLADEGSLMLGTGGDEFV